jgi:hypothetical protein
LATGASFRGSDDDKSANVNANAILLRSPDVELLTQPQGDVPWK